MKDKTKFFLIFGISLLLIGSIGMSYAIFTTDTERRGALNIVAGNVSCHIRSDDLNEEMEITIPSQQEKIIHIKLSNTSVVPVHSKLIYEGTDEVEMYRELQSEDIIDVESLGKNEERDYRIVLRNHSDTEQTITFKSKCGLASKELELEEIEKEITSDISIPNAPKLTDGLIPVKYDEANKTWVKADVTNPLDNLWYDYDKQMWANAVTVEETGKQTRSYYQQAEINTPIPMEDINTMWVWIPRYEYDYVNIANYAGGTKEQPGAIRIKFLEETKETLSDQRLYMLHPAFTFGTQELEGFWYGKFEPSNKENTCDPTKQGNVDVECDLTTLTPQIKPGVTSWRGIRVSTAFQVAQSMNANEAYGFNKTSDVHMSKNDEWGAVAYLSQSEYGKQGNTNYTGANKEVYQNKSKNFITGSSNGTPGQSDYRQEGQYAYDDLTTLENGGGLAGPGASTTGTIYGVYDMSGGAWERVMNVLEDEDGMPRSGNNTQYNSGFSGKLNNGSYVTDGRPFPEIKYYSTYDNGSTYSNACNGGACLGEALSETAAWYGDYTTWLTSAYPWLVRGGGSGDAARAGVFYFTITAGESHGSNSFRLVLTP